MYKKILVPTDASEYSKRALTTALELARVFDAEIELLHVTFTPQAYWGYALSYGITVSQEELNRNGEAALEATLAGLEIGQVSLKRKLKSGHPVNEIIKEIGKEQVELVVMGSHGYGPIMGSVLGSVSQRVLQRAECPVLIVK